MRRYDLLCIEGISRALRIFLGLDKPPQYKLVHPAGGEANLVTATVSSDVRIPVPRTVERLSEFCVFATDPEDPSVLRRRHPAEREVHGAVIRVLH